MSNIIRVTDGDPFESQGTVVVATGTDVETGERVTFAGDHRVMGGLYAAVSEEGEIDAQVEAWQVLSRQPAEEGS